MIFDDDYFSCLNTTTSNKILCDETLNASPMLLGNKKSGNFENDRTLVKDSLITLNDTNISNFSNKSMETINTTDDDITPIIASTANSSEIILSNITSESRNDNDNDNDVDLSNVTHVLVGSVADTTEHNKSPEYIKISTSDTTEDNELTEHIKISTPDKTENNELPECIESSTPGTTERDEHTDRLDDSELSNNNKFKPLTSVNEIKDHELSAVQLENGPHDHQNMNPAESHISYTNNSKLNEPEHDNFQTLYKYVNGIFIQNLNNKKECDDIKKRLFEITNRLTSIEQNFNNFKPDISAQILGNELKIDKLIQKKEPQNKIIHKKIDENRNRIGNITNFDNVSKRLDGDIRSLNHKIEKQQEELKHLMNTICKLPTEIHEFENELSNPKQKLKPYYYKPVDYANSNINHDVVFLVDSNLGWLKPEIMNENNTCIKFFCPTIDHIGDLLKEVTITKQPHTIFIHTGTNHLSEKHSKTDELEDEYIRILDKLKCAFTNTKIVISSILPRKEKCLDKPIQFLNDFLYGVCSSTSHISFMRNINISRFALVDNKHIDEDAFKTLISNIRYTLFDKVPPLYPKTSWNKFQ